MKSRSRITKNKFYQPSKIQLIKRGLLTISFFAFVTACTKSKNNTGNNSNECSGVTKKLSADIRPIIQVFCSGCDETEGNNGESAVTAYSRI
ncbi:MAG: hypothetical protein ACM3H8_14635 [Sphingobacteriales bacterium]